MLQQRHLLTCCQAVDDVGNEERWRQKQTWSACAIPCAIRMRHSTHATEDITSDLIANQILINCSGNFILYGVFPHTCSSMARATLVRAESYCMSGCSWLAVSVCFVLQYGERHGAKLGLLPIEKLTRDIRLAAPPWHATAEVELATLAYNGHTPCSSSSLTSAP